jgi:hypothetical protein
MIKTLYHKPVPAGQEAAAEKERAEARARQHDLSDKARAAVVPVKHTIKIEVVK